MVVLHRNSAIYRWRMPEEFAAAEKTAGGEDMSTETVDIKGGRQVDAVEMIEQTHPQLCALNPNHNLAGSSQCLC